MEKQLVSLDAEERRLREEIAGDGARVEELESEENAHFREYYELKSGLFDAEEEERSLRNRVAHADTQLAILQRTNALNLVLLHTHIPLLTLCRFCWH